MADVEQNWEFVERLPGSPMPIYRCTVTGQLGHIKGRFLPGRKATVVPYRCHIQGCKKSAVHRNYGLRPGGHYKWVCEDHRKPV